MARVLFLKLLFTLGVMTTLFAQKDSGYIRLPLIIPGNGVVLDKGWKFHKGDDADWSKPDFDDKQWQRIDPTQDVYDLAQLKESGIGWFRLRLKVDSAILKKSLALMIEQTGASEIYLNGNLIYTLGNVSSDQGEIKTFDPFGSPVALQFGSGAFQVLAIRYAYKKYIPYFIFAGRVNYCFKATVNNTNQAIGNNERSIPAFAPDLLKTGIFFILLILHFVLYVFYPQKKANLFFSLFAMAALITNIMYISAINLHDTELKMYLLWFTIIFFNLYHLLFLKALYVIVSYKKNLVYLILLGCFLLSIPLYFWPYHLGWVFGFVILPNLILIECARISFLAMKRRQKGAIILAVGAIVFFIFYFSFYIVEYIVPSDYLTGTFYDLTYNIGVISLPVATSIFLAFESAFTNRSLEVQLREVQKLSEQIVAREQEKQQILTHQNRLLEEEVTERTAKLTLQQTELKNTLEDLKKAQAQLIQSEKEKLRAHHDREVHELEAKALRAQMNPHFIFNCMNSIKSLVQKNEDEKAVIYLTTFSKLLRTILQNSDQREISLYDEIETCKLYTQLESMRFGNKFSYHFTVDESIDMKSITVPALIIQPFIENAIWHGIMPKEEGGTLTVSVTKNGDAVLCIIEDDGIGRETSKQNKFKGEPSTHQSKGVHLTQSRIDLDNTLNQRNASVEIIDKISGAGETGGTKVILIFSGE